MQSTISSSLSSSVANGIDKKKKVWTELNVDMSILIQSFCREASCNCHPIMHGLLLNRVCSLSSDFFRVTLVSGYFTKNNSMFFVLSSCLVSSRLVSSRLVSSRLVSSRLVLSCLVLSCLVLSCLVLSCLVLSCLVLSCLVLSCLVLCDSVACGVVSLCVVCCLSVVLSVVSWLLACVSSLVFPCTCVCRLSLLSVLCWFLGLCFVFAHVLVSIVGFWVARLKLEGITACGSICINTGKLTRSRHSKD